MEVETGNVNITGERQGKEKQTSPQVCITHKALLFPLSLAQREACKLQECERRAAFKNLWEGTVICYDVLRPTRPNSWTDKNEQNSRNHTNNHVSRECYRNTQNRARRVTKSEQICSEEPRWFVDSTKPLNTFSPLRVFPWLGETELRSLAVLLHVCLILARRHRGVWGLAVLRQ